MTIETELDIVDSGKVTTPAPVGTNVLNDSTKNWATNVHKNRLVRITSGLGVGQTALIDSNTASALVIRGTWVTALGTTSEYVILGVDFAQILRDVLGQGFNIGPDNPLEVHDPKVDTLETSMGRTLFSMDFWSDMQEEVQVTSTAGNKTLPDVVIADLPAGTTIVRAVAMFKFRMVENTNAAENKINVDQYIQVKKAGQSFNNAIKMVNTAFTVAATTREGGDVVIGNIDLAGANKVDGNATYNFQWTDADALGDNLNFNDVQVGLRILYSV
ncbi:MAG: hypothetical protein HWN68_19080 [Desulfobacterales bacterium]|nr:hypothetical protein [Desulfobacterales bacterium]